MLNDPDDVRYRWFHQFINALILIAAFNVVYPFIWGPEDNQLRALLRIADDFILWVFVIEFTARLLVIRNWRPKSVRLRPHRVVWYFLVSRAKFIFSPWGFIDLLAILPVLPFLQSLRVLRLLRLFRSFQFFRYANPLETLTAAFRDNALLFTVAMSFVVGAISLSAMLFFLAEVDANPAVSSLGDTFWWAIVTVTTVGFGDITPVTDGGKVIGAGLMLAGMFIIAMFAGVISSTLVGHLLPLRQEQVRMSSIADHVIIAGWNSEIPMMLMEMQTEYGSDMPPVIVFAPRDRPEELEEQYVFVHGDFRKENEYDKVRLRYAKTVVVVADESGESVPAMRDASTVLTIFTIRSFERKLKDVNRAQPIHIVAEILDQENYEHATVAGANEVIETSRLGSSLLAHTAGNPGVGTVITNLMLASRNNVYAASLPPAFIEGRVLTFAELQDRARDEFEILVIGVVHNDKMSLNPPAEQSVYAADRMVYIGPKNLD